jgi:crotonobetainyl-CoA:carnitine CoA-transferase CaiB-like acyl-CoA transferase
VADVLGVPELKTDPRFQERDTRKKNRKLLTLLLEAKLADQNTEHWVESFNKNDVPSGAILTLEGAVSQAQVEHRNTFGTASIEGIGELKLFNLTAKFSKTPGFVESPPPSLGQHTKEILHGIGYSDEAIKRFKDTKIV